MQIKLVVVIVVIFIDSQRKRIHYAQTEQRMLRPINRYHHANMALNIAQVKLVNHAKQILNLFVELFKSRKPLTRTRLTVEFADNLTSNRPFPLRTFLSHLLSANSNPR